MMNYPNQVYQMPWAAWIMPMGCPCVCSTGPAQNSFMPPAMVPHAWPVPVPVPLPIPAWHEKMLVDDRADLSTPDPDLVFPKQIGIEDRG